MIFMLNNCNVTVKSCSNGA